MSDVKKLRPIIPKTISITPTPTFQFENLPQIIPMEEGIAALEISLKIYRLTRRFHRASSFLELIEYMDGTKTPPLDSSIWDLCLSSINDYSRKFQDPWNVVAHELWKWEEMKNPDINLDPRSVYKIYTNCINKERGKVMEINKIKALEKVKAEDRARAEENARAEQIAKGEKRAKAADIEPIKTDDNLWEFKGFIYEITGFYNDEQAKLMILEEFDKERRYFERLRLKFGSNSQSKVMTERPRIPENVRIEVWRRDGGKCARCGSRINLEYDHIVPISKGGSNTARNIELLCEKCNRSKSNNIA
jgi:hypothetical protein